MKDISLQKIFEKAKTLTNADKIFIKEAYDFAANAHKGQKRKTGEDYIIHPLYTAFFISDLGLGKETIAAALLHDVVEDCNVSVKDLETKFGPTVAKLVESVTKLRRMGGSNVELSNLEFLRRFLLVASNDLRALIIKLADRLHNAITIEGLPPERRISYAKEIEYTYATLADYLGIYFFKRQFDNIAFKILHPEDYQKIHNYFQTHHKERGYYVEKTIRKIELILKNQKIRATVSGREKSYYSFYKKIQRYIKEGKIHSESEYGRIYDNYAFRILVKNQEDCYRTLGIIHSTWHPLISEFDDYIANPKPNGYKALQTTVFGDENKLCEIQILTYEMHDYNEFGPASHFAYKASGKRFSNYEGNAFAWLRRLNLFRRLKENKNDYRIKVFEDKIFVLTPQNEVKQLPKGSTPIDFAYSVHSDVGRKCRGAKVNSKIVPLNYELKTGDQVEIIIDRNAKFPSEEWLNYAVFQTTKNKIKHQLREKEEKEAIGRGSALLNEALKKFHTSINLLRKERSVDFELLIYKNNAKNIQDLLARIGFGLLKIEKVIAFLFPTDTKKTPIKKALSKVIVEDSKNTAYQLAECCKPKPGDEIIAFTTIRRGIKIHKATCFNIPKFEAKRILKAKWG